MNNQCEIRAAQPGDIHAIHEIYAHEVLHGSASFEVEPPGIEEMTQRWHDAVNNNLPYLVGVIEGRISGYAYAGKYRLRHAYRFSVENSVYVAQCSRRRGIGRELLSSLIENCKQRGFKQMIAIIGDSSHVASIELHKALEFRFVGVLNNVGWKHDRWLDTVLMQRSL